MKNINFLENLKNAVENGEFNSDSVKMIIEIDKLSDKKTISNNQIENEIKMTKLGIKVPTTEEEIAFSSQYEDNIKNLKKIDTTNKQLAILIDVEDMVKASIDDMLAFTTELKTIFSESFEQNDIVFKELYLKINEIENNYSKFNVNK